MKATDATGFLKTSNCKNLYFNSNHQIFTLYFLAILSLTFRLGLLCSTSTLLGLDWVRKCYKSLFLCFEVISMAFQCSLPCKCKYFYFWQSKLFAGKVSVYVDQRFYFELNYAEFLVHCKQLGILSMIRNHHFRVV